uniref:Uncharacterized protein n=1 Tax=viral metagenome TaxID=1070528 RepID=A0A6M3IMI3_9ZZZZ
MNELKDCHDCGAKPGKMHKNGCDTERCSECGDQRLQCDCENHDKAFARWTGIWPGKAEADYLGVDLNEFEIKYGRLFFKKPCEKPEKNVWDENPEYPRSDWKDEVNNDDTNLGYWDWVEHQIESNETEKSAKSKKLTVDCCLCGNPCDAVMAHYHQKKYIGDECCWDERLRSSE